MASGKEKEEKETPCYLVGIGKLVMETAGIKTPWAHPQPFTGLPELSARLKGGVLKPTAKHIHQALCPGQPSGITPLKSALNPLTA